MRPHHLPFFLGLTANRRVRAHLGGTSPLRHRIAQGSSYVRGTADGTVWVVQIGPMRRPIGVIALDRHADMQVPELSYQFHPRWWGRGLATEACAAVADAVSRSGNTRRIVAETQADNAASRRLLARLGFVEHRHLTRYGAAQVIYLKSLEEP